MKTGGSMLVMSLLMTGLLAMSGTWESADAALVTELDFTSGAANWGGKQGRMLDRLLDQDGTLKTGQFQSMSDIMDPITHGHKTFSLFTSGLNGAPAPSASIEGMSITMDLSSLFLGSQRGDEIHAWNIGGMATGLFNPQTSEFSLSWEHLFSERGGQGDHDKMRDHSAAFFLQGTAVVAQAPVPLSASLIFFATGFALMGGLFWWKPGRRQGPLPN